MKDIGDEVLPCVGACPNNTIHTPVLFMVDPQALGLVRKGTSVRGGVTRHSTASKAKHTGPWWSA